MNEGFRPLGQHGVKKTGACGLCGVVGPRSWTHVPPHAAGNDQPSATMGTRPVHGLSRVQPGHRRDGGTAMWFLCEKCNGTTGRFDEEFVRWWRMLVMDWPNTAARQSGESRVGNFPAVRPGAFIRSVLSGMFALNPTLRPRYPEIATAILTGEPAVLPSGLRLLMSLYRGDTRYVLGHTTVVETQLHGDSLAVNLEGEWAWPPLHLALADESGPRRWPDAMNISAWMRDHPDVIRDVPAVLGVFDESDLSTAHLRLTET